MCAASRRLLAACFFVTILGVVPLATAVDGTFEGRVVNAPPDAPLPKGWIYVEGRNHLLRRVEVAHATIVFSGQVPASQRRKCGPDCLEQGLEVRVTAEQDRNGEWRAKRVEILHLVTHFARCKNDQSGRSSVRDRLYST